MTVTNDIRYIGVNDHKVDLSECKKCYVCKVCGWVYEGIS